MRNWASAANPGLTASWGVAKFYMSQTSSWWRISSQRS